MTAQGPERKIRLLRSVLENTARVFMETRERHKLLPRTGSLAALEVERQSDFAGAWSRQPVQDCYSIADVRLTAARDHLVSLARLLDEPAMVYGPVPVARAVLECSARVWWALDPSLDLKRRVIRGALDRFDSAWEISQIDSDAKEVAQPQMAKILAGAQEFNLHARPDHRGRLRSIGDEELPGHLKVITMQLGEKGALAYRLFSAVAHGGVYGLFEQTQVVVPATPESLGYAQPSMAMDRWTIYTALVVLSFAEAFERQVRLYGWDRTEWGATWTEAGRLVGRLLREE